MITFPGHGAPGKKCGSTVYHGCWTCKDYFESISKCGLKECPDCYEIWALDEGQRAAERMTEFLNSPRYLKVVQDAEAERWEAANSRLSARVEETRYYRIEVYHIVVSFRAATLDDREDIARYRKLARDLLRAHGIYGECSIPHRRDQGDEGAHYHFLALAGYISPGGVDDDDVVLKVIQHEGLWATRNLLDRQNIVKYACTHAVITGDSHCVTWSGCVANNKFPGLRVKHDHKEQPMCPHCGGTETFLVKDKDWLFREEVETWTAPDRPPPCEDQRSLTEFA